MNTLYQKVTNSYFRFFSRNADVVFQAPGRVNLIGEHTDYNNGFVLPCAIDRGTYMAIRSRSDSNINVISIDNNSERNQWQSSLPIDKDADCNWANYLRGVNEQFLKRDMNPTGMDIVVTGNIPLGAGLSSSASFCVVFATAINALNRFHLSPTEIALLCQAAENEFVGCNCGIMDQLISVAGQHNHALLIDCKNLTYTSVPMPDDMQVVIIDSRVTRGLVDSKYNKRRAQCEQAARIMNIDSLRDSSYPQLLENASLMDDVIFRRARHIITGSDRAQKAAQSLRYADYATLSQLMCESHISMRDDFEITTDEIDYLVEIISNVLQDSGGVRMTGGGFGGCVVALTPNHLSKLIVDTVNELYFKKTGLHADIHLCVASNGASEVTNQVVSAEQLV